MCYFIHSQLSGDPGVLEDEAMKSTDNQGKGAGNHFTFLSAFLLVEDTYRQMWQCPILLTFQAYDLGQDLITVNSPPDMHRNLDYNWNT